MLILDLWGISFHAVVVFGLGKNLLFKSVRRHCVLRPYLFHWIQQPISNLRIQIFTNVFDTLEQLLKVLSAHFYRDFFVKNNRIG